MDRSIMTLPVEFISDTDAKEFVRKYTTVFQHPSMRSGKTVYLILPRFEFDGVCMLAVNSGGSIIYDQ